jgi:hypothetical protein
MSNLNDDKIHVKPVDECKIGLNKAHAVEIPKVSIETPFGRIEETEETLFNMILSTNGMSIQYIEKPTEKQIEIALKQNPLAIQFVMKGPMMNLTKQKTKELWVEAMKMEYDPCKDHPINHFLKIYKDIYWESDEDKADVYKAYIEANPMWLEVIVEAVNKNDFHIELWKHMLTNAAAHGGYNIFSKCPYQKELIRYALDISYGYFPYATVSVTTYDDLINYIIDYPYDGFKMIDRLTTKNRYEVYRDILNACEDVPATHLICDAIPKDDFTVDNVAIILESKHWMWFLDSWCHCFLKRDVVLYVFDKFEPKDLIENLSESILNHYIGMLPFFKKMKYKRLIKSYKKEVKK